ncbi:Hypothetical_protein [Hexamita inflata]|uniref:Hypothetical_protein n=1 Tax=Hexamita inflata TaxID=28002 RepID=A0AA86TJX2_9EUKA|nr:Hypothetical protein HINF_LOCUS7126 [Hexamita inflata]
MTNLPTMTKQRPYSRITKQDLMHEFKVNISPSRPQTHLSALRINKESEAARFFKGVKIHSESLEAEIHKINDKIQQRQQHLQDWDNKLTSIQIQSLKESYIDDQNKQKEITDSLCFLQQNLNTMKQTIFKIASKVGMHIQSQQALFNLQNYLKRPFEIKYSTQFNNNPSKLQWFKTSEVKQLVQDFTTGQHHYYTKWHLQNESRPLILLNELNLYKQQLKLIQQQNMLQLQISIPTKSSFEKPQITSRYQQLNLPSSPKRINQEQNQKPQQNLWQDDKQKNNIVFEHIDSKNLSNEYKLAFQVLRNSLIIPQTYNFHCQEQITNIMERLTEKQSNQLSATAVNTLAKMDVLNLEIQNKSLKQKVQENTQQQSEMSKENIKMKWLISRRNELKLAVETTDFRLKSIKKCADILNKYISNEAVFYDQAIPVYVRNFYIFITDMQKKLNKADKEKMKRARYKLLQIQSAVGLNTQEKQVHKIQEIQVLPFQSPDLKIVNYKLFFEKNKTKLQQHEAIKENIRKQQEEKNREFYK